MNHLNLLREVEVEVELDEEWVMLILMAKRMGIQLDEIRQFFKSSGCVYKI